MRSARLHVDLIAAAVGSGHGKTEKLTDFGGFREELHECGGFSLRRAVSIT